MHIRAHLCVFIRILCSVLSLFFQISSYFCHFMYINNVEMETVNTTSALNGTENRYRNQSCVIKFVVKLAPYQLRRKDKTQTHTHTYHAHWRKCDGLAMVPISKNSTSDDVQYREHNITSHTNIDDIAWDSSFTNFNKDRTKRQTYIQFWQRWRKNGNALLV